MGSKVTGPGGGWTTGGVCGRDTKFEHTDFGELFAPPRLILTADHVGLRELNIRVRKI